MKIVIPDDYQDAIAKLDAFKLLAGHEVIRYREPARDLDELVERLRPAECVVEIRERIDFSRALIERLPNLRLIALVGSRSRAIDYEAAKEHQVLWTQSTALPSRSAVVERDRNSPAIQTASYHVQDYFVQQAASATSGAKTAAAESDSLVALSLKSARLQPGQRTVGVVWFEREGNARELSLRVPVGNLIFDFPLSFDQKR